MTDSTSRKGSKDTPNGSPAAEPASAERRTRRRLRDLCDEVLASYRVARGEDPISESDREAAKELLPGMLPVER
jgi:hypothetical protein